MKRNPVERNVSVITLSTLNPAAHVRKLLCLCVYVCVWWKCHQRSPVFMWTIGCWLIPLCCLTHTPVLFDSSPCVDVSGDTDRCVQPAKLKDKATTTEILPRLSIANLHELQIQDSIICPVTAAWPAKPSVRKECLGDRSLGFVSLLLQLRRHRPQCLWIFLGLLQFAATLSYKCRKHIPVLLLHFTQ